MQHISASTHAACYDAVGNHGMHGKQDQPRSSALLPDSVFFGVWSDTAGCLSCWTLEAEEAGGLFAARTSCWLDAPGNSRQQSMSLYDASACDKIDLMPTVWLDWLFHWLLCCDWLIWSIVWLLDSFLSSLIDCLLDCSWTTTCSIWWAFGLINWSIDGFDGWWSKFWAG